MSAALDFAFILFIEVDIVGHVYGVRFIFVVMGVRNCTSITSKF